LSTYHPKYGELLTSREVSDLTGFTMNQLRNQRTKPETSPIKFVRQGGTSWYRKSDVDAYIEINGGSEWEYIGGPESIATPLVNESAVGQRKEYLDELSKITTRNAWTKWYTWFTDQSGWKDPYGDTRKWQVELWKLSTGEDLDELYPKSAFYKMRSEDPLRFWPSITFAMRKAVAQVRGHEITDQEIIEIPVGEVPPSKLD
jgi:hypothetical protein